MFMKKLLIGFCAASLLTASAIGYAGSVTFVNEYRQPVTFVASSGYVYNPVAQGTILPGGHFTFQVYGPVTPDYNFMAYVPSGSNVVTGCGYIGETVGNVTVKAGWSNETGRFGCWVFPTPVPFKHVCHKNKHRIVVYDNNNSGVYYNGQGAMYSNSGGAYNNQGPGYNNSGRVYNNGQDTIYGNSGVREW